MELIQSNKKGRNLLYGGCIYVVDKEKEEKIYWRCEKEDTAVED